MKHQKPIIYIFCEGETEKQYFTQLSRILNNSFKIITIDLGGGTKVMHHPEQIKTKVKKRITQDKATGLTQKVFIVFDLDIFIDKSKLQTTQNILRDYELIYTNMCFEYWILSHFEKYTVFGGKSRYLGRIKRHLPRLTNDKFTGRNDFDWLDTEKIHIAIRNTKEVNDSSTGNLKDRDPYSDVYQIIEFLETQS